VASVALLGLGAHFLWEGATHKGRGTLTVGGDEPGTGGMISTPEERIVVSERAFRRDRYAAAAFFVFLGGSLIWDAVRHWNKKGGTDVAGKTA
jgi:membrane-bound ClpP family serine protease